jgi:branched-chain amino acid transport system permease protein
MILALAQLVLSGLLIGGVYALISVGLTLIFGVMKIVNFAHGEFLMAAMYATYWLQVLLGWDPYVSVALVLPASFLFGLVVERLVIRPSIGKPHLVVVFATMGLSVLMQNLALFLWRGDYRPVRGALGETTWVLGPFRMNGALVVACTVSVGVTLLVLAWLRYTDFGKGLRATVQDRDVAMLMGIDVARVFSVTFAVGTALVGLAGALITPAYPTYPTVGLSFVLVAYVIVVLGGLGSVLGALLGGMCIGVVESLTGYLIASSLSQLFSFLVFLAVLVFRPAGLLGHRPAALAGAP